MFNNEALKNILETIKVMINQNHQAYSIQHEKQEKIVEAINKLDFTISSVGDNLTEISNYLRRIENQQTKNKDILNSIKEKIPYQTSISTNYIESKLNTIADHLYDINEKVWMLSKGIFVVPDYCMLSKERFRWRIDCKSN